MKLKQLMMLICILMASTASAYNFCVDGIYYNISGTNATVTYRYIDGYYEDQYFYSGNVNIPERVTYNNKSYSVTSIEINAFFRCTNLTSVTIPNSIIS